MKGNWEELFCIMLRTGKRGWEWGFKKVVEGRSAVESKYDLELTHWGG